MPGDFKVVRIKQVFRFNTVRINEVPLYNVFWYVCVYIELDRVRGSQEEEEGWDSPKTKDRADRSESFPHI